MIKLGHTSIHPGSLCNSIVVRKSNGYPEFFADGSSSQIGVAASSSSLLALQRSCEVFDPIPGPGDLSGGAC